MRTPWGESDEVIILVRGVVWVSTPSHGGFLFTSIAAHKLLTAEARQAAEFRNGQFAYEEDCKYAIVLYEHPEYDAVLFDAYRAEIGAPKPKRELVKARALETISAWDADYLIARGLTPGPKAYAHYLQRQEEDKLRTDRSPDLIVSASGDWANWVLKGRVGVITADDKRYTVPVAEYDALQKSKGLTLLSRLQDVQPVVPVNAQAKAWKLTDEDSTRIACDCGKPARFGRTVNGGAPFFYECEQCIPADLRIA